MYFLLNFSPSMDSLQLRPASSCFACPRTQARPSSQSVCVTRSTTVLPSTWTTTCSPTTRSQQTVQTQRTEAERLHYECIFTEAIHIMHWTDYLPNLYIKALFICWVYLNVFDDFFPTAHSVVTISVLLQGKQGDFKSYRRLCHDNSLCACLFGNI